MAKTVITHLIDGDPQGTRYSSISNKICLMYVIPRSNLSYLNEQKNLHKPAFYILIGENENAKPEAYIGETENFKERVKDHENKKPFWQKALIFVAKGADMTKVDVQYLEYKAFTLAKKANTFLLNNNKKVPKAPNLPEFQQSTVDEFFEDIKFLTAFASCNIFEVNQPQQEHLFYTKSRNCDACGFYNKSGFTILKGSIIAADATRSLTLRWENRKKLLTQYTTKKNNQLVLKTDKIFSSPSAAANFCTGRSSNGWTEWKDKDGQTLDEVYRKQLE